jgi:predicted ATP-grasp superfamily ATP-dependent carboligase
MVDDLHASALARPAIVLGVETQIGLALVRELGRAGVPVVAVSHDAHAIGLASRYVWRRVVCGPPRSQRVIDELNRLGAELGPVSLLTVSEANLAWINSVRGRLGDQIRPAVPAQAALAKVLDKSLTLDTARAVGVQVPLTLEVSSLAELQLSASSFPYPAVLKWKDPNAVAPRLSARGLALFKAEYVLDEAGLLAVGHRYADLGEWPLIQQYCPGRGLGQFFYMRDGVPIRRFQHLRIAEWPPEGGFSAVCDALPLDQHLALQERSVALLQALGWEGVAMVEYRYDDASRQAVLMEVNGRFWGSLPLAVACGAGFALHAHAAALGMAPPRLPPPRTDLRCRMLIAEIKGLVRVLFQPRRIGDPLFRRRPFHDLLRFLVDFLRPGRRYFVAARDDMAPLWRDLRNALDRRPR